MIVLFPARKKLQLRGQRYLSRGQFERALHLFRKALLIAPTPENTFNLALALTALKKFPEAEEYLRKLFQEYPDNELSSLTLAQVLLRQRKWKEVATVYRQLLNKNPQNKTISKYLERAEDVVAREKYVRAQELSDSAQRELEARKYQQALEQLQKALEYEPLDPNIVHNTGYVHMKLKNYQQAHKYLEQALSLVPDNKTFQRNLNLVRSRLKRLNGL